MAMLTLRISDELSERLTLMAAKTGRTKTYFVKKLIVDGLEEIEDDILMELLWKEYVAEGGREIGPGVPHEIFKRQLAKERMDNSLAKTGSKATPKTRSKSTKNT